MTGGHRDRHNLRGTNLRDITAAVADRDFIFEVLVDLPGFSFVRIDWSDGHREWELSLEG